MPKVTSYKASPTRKRRAKKDPNAPKRALSAFMLFSQDKRAQIKEENPDATFGQIGKLLGEAWKNADDKGKAPYLAKAEKEKERYAIAIAAYRSKGSSAHAGYDDDEEEDE